MGQVSRYKYVSCPLIRGKSHGWLAQKWGVGSRARFPTDIAAAKWLAKQMKVPLQSLQLLESKSGDKEKVSGRQGVSAPHGKLLFSSYRGVVYSRGRWLARFRNQIVGRFDSQIIAGQCVARHRRVKVKTLKKELPSNLCKKIFVSAYSVFRDYVPGDYHSMVEHELESSVIYQQERRRGRGVYVW